MVSCLNKPGFTLAEVLIALALLGVVAAFTIPKILQTQGNHNNDAIFKEVIGVIENEGAVGLTKGEKITQLISRLDQMLNPIEKRTYTDSSNGFAGSHYVLANGAGLTVQYFGNCTPDGLMLFILDADGLEHGTNTPGEDTFCGRIRLGNIGGCIATDYRGTSKLGQVFVSNNCQPADLSTPQITPWAGDVMFQRIYK